jgi:hypothetical protein
LREVGHPRIRIDAEHGAAGGLELAGRDAGTGADVEDADIDSLTLSLVGGGHLLFADRDPDPPTTATVNKLVTTVLADVVQRRPRRSEH